MSANELMDLADKARIELTLQTRERIIRNLTADGKIPDSQEDRDFLMKAMDSMDRTVLTKAKIKSDDTAAQSQANSAKLIAQLLMTAGSKQRGRRTEPVTLEGVDVTDVVDGETFIGIQTITHTQIMGTN